MAESVKDLKVKIALVTTDFKKGLTDAQKQADSFSKASSKAFDVVKTAVLGVAGALTGIGIASAKEFADTEAALAKVNTLLDLSQSEANDYADAIKKGARESGMAYDDYAEAVYQAISAGVDYKDAVNFVTEANKLAKGGFADLTTATDITTTVLNAYGMEASEQSKVMDMLIQTQNKGKTTVAELGSALGQVIGTASTANVGFSDVSAAMAIMTSNGISTSQSTTYLNNMLSELSKGGTKVSNILKEETGMSFQELMANGMSLGEALGILKGATDEQGLSFMDVFGSSEAARGAMSLLNGGVEGYTETLDTMLDSQGSAQAAFDTMNGTVKEQLSQSVNNMKNEFADLGDMFMNEFGSSIVWLIDRFNETIDKLTELPKWLEENKQLLTVLAIIVGTVTAAILAYNIALNATTIATTIATTAGAAFGAVMAFITSPITLVILAIGAVIAIIYLLIANWDLICAKTKEVWSAICSTVTGWVNTLKTNILNGFETAKQWVFDKFDAIKNGIKEKIEAAADIVNRVIEKIKGFFKFEWSLPKLKMPHVSIQGEFSLMPLKVPKFDIAWKSSGGIFKNKTLLPNGMGVGDAMNGIGTNAEAILPINQLPSLLGLDKNGANGVNVTLNIDNFYNNDDRDIENLASELAYMIKNKNFGFGGAY